MNLTEGTLIGGRYRIVKFLGRGGFGCTYLVQHKYLDKRYAVKEFFPVDICNRDESGRVSVGANSKAGEFDHMLRKFIKEANTLVGFSGTKGIVNAVDVFEENGTAYFVMDYIEGMSVERMLQLEGPMSENMAVGIIRETAEALARVHARNYLHLDIKPDNIMLDFDYHPTLIDFGVSKQYDAADGNNTSTLMGFTPGFAPIEQSNSKVGKFYPATDIYALGATLYCMLTGQTPDTASDRINYPRPLSADLPDGTSPNVAAAIEAAMQLRVADRPQSVADFLAILNRKPAPAPRLTKPAPKPTRQDPKPAPKPRKPLSWKAITISTVAVIAITIAGIWQSHNATKKAEKVENEVENVVTNDIEGYEPDVAFSFTTREVAPNLSMVIKYKGKVYYVTEEEWKSTPESIKQQKQIASNENLRILQKIYSNALEYYSLPDFETFQNDMKDENKRRKFHTNIQEEYSVPDFETFSRDIGAVVVEKLGLVVKGDGQSFMIEPEDLTSEELTWGEAMKRFGKRLPDKTQAEVMAKQYKDINRALITFGFSPMGERYWTSTEKDSGWATTTVAWVYMYNGRVGYTDKTHPTRVRTVAPVPVASAK